MFLNSLSGNYLERKQRIFSNLTFLKKSNTAVASCSSMHQHLLHSPFVFIKRKTFSVNILFLLIIKPII